MLVRMSTSDKLTTIKIRTGLRERISGAAAAEHQTVNAFLETVLDDRERRRRLASVAAVYSTTDDPDTLADWREETRQWDTIGTTTTAGDATDVQ